MSDALERARACRAHGDFVAGLAHADRAWVELPDGGDRDEAGFLRLFFRHRTGDMQGVLDLRNETLAVLRQRAGGAGGAGSELIGSLRAIVLCAAELSRFDVALPLAYEAQAQLADGDMPRERGLLLQALGAVFERMGDPWQAERLMQEAVGLAQVHGTANERFLTANNLAAVLIGAFHLMRGAGTADPDAMAALERALPHAREALALSSQLSDPVAALQARGNLGEILAHLGQIDEAEALLESAAAEAQAEAFVPVRHRVACTRAECDLRRGDATAALARLEGVLGHDRLAPATELRARHTAYLAARQLGRTEAALAHLERRGELERQRSVTQLRAQSEHFVTRFEAEHAVREAAHQRDRAAAVALAARRDPLTGLSNRLDMSERLPGLLNQAGSARAPIALALLDVDHFKALNDRFGQAVGDRVLVEVAAKLREGMRSTDLAARLGGEAFLLALPEASAERARDICERLRQQVEGHTWGMLETDLTVTVSIGIAEGPPLNEADLLKRADAALNRAKAAGRNRTELG